MNTTAPAAARPAGDVPPASPGYRRFVRPGHPVVRELLGVPPERAAGAAPAVGAALETARQRLRYDSSPGRHEFEELWRRAAADDGPVVLNCIDAACVLASHLRAGGFGDDEVWVALGGLSSPSGADLGAEFHAWLAVLLDDGGVLWIDPANLQPQRRTGDDVLAEHRLYAVFNDRRVSFLDDDKRRLLCGGRRGRLRLYLFGRAHPELAAAIADAGFQRLVEALARHGSADAAGADPAAVEGWTAAGLLRAEGGRLHAGDKLLVVPRAAEAEAFTATARHVERYAELVATAVPTLHRAYEACEAAARWSWPEVAHAVVDGMLLDLCVGREFGILGRVRRQRGESVVWAFENVSADQGVGVVWAESPDGDWAAGQLWHRAVERPAVALTPTMVELLGTLALGGAPPTASTELLVLRHHRAVHRTDGGYRVVWPTYGPADAARLSAPLAAAGRRLYAEAVAPAVDELAGLPWWRRCRGDDSYRHAALRLLLDYGCQRVFAAGLLEPPPDGEIPDTWGRWLWLGTRGDALPRTRDALPEAMEATA